jgi:hypothetical protein
VDYTLCHGEGVLEERLDMPTSHLPQLSGALLFGYKKIALDAVFCAEL